MCIRDRSTGVGSLMWRRGGRAVFRGAYGAARRWNRKYSQRHSLDKLVFVDKLREETPERIAEIWNRKHQSLPCVSAVIPTKKYKEFKEKALDYPRFVFPVPRNQGFLQVMQEAQMEVDTILFTNLADFQESGKHAPISLSLLYYTDLQESNDLVLLRGDVDTKKLTTIEAQYLVNQLQIWYQIDTAKFELIKQFNDSPEGFDFDEVIKQVQVIPS
eukprot:TRINITY_DN1887_c0_g1_i2.p1 TRINITY_DN1887_c0_g1~~TRINITY_DN1887_c0_g1_i2.p1  ORF type:complete len:216 (+),score=28.23 TRINITY_DN1887_c0_g1_i2:39-686(+)